MQGKKEKDRARESRPTSSFHCVDKKNSEKKKKKRGGGSLAPFFRTVPNKEELKKRKKIHLAFSYTKE